VRGHDAQDLTVETKDAGLLRVAQPHAILGQCRKDGLEVEGRAADDLEKLTGRGLLVKRFSQVSIACGQLLGQAIAMTAWSAKVFSSAIWFSENGRGVAHR